jgi:hypothetical protein
VLASMDAPRRERMVTALPPGVPLWSLSTNRREPSRRPARGCPLIWGWTDLVTLNGLIELTRLSADRDPAPGKDEATPSSAPSLDDEGASSRATRG